jgi:hypothetical protein
MERYSGALKLSWWGDKYLDRSLVLLCSLLAATSPRSSLPSALRGGQRAHAPPTGGYLHRVKRQMKKEKGGWWVHGTRKRDRSLLIDRERRPFVVH